MCRAFLSPNPVLNGDGSVKLPGLDNHSMGTIFEELVRRFNEENNEEAGEHWTPRDAVKLMAMLIFLPIADQIQSGTYLLYDRDTESLWVEGDTSLNAISVQQKGKQLPLVDRPAAVAWSDWKTSHPGSRLVVGAREPETGPASH